MSKTDEFEKMIARDMRRMPLLFSGFDELEKQLKTCIEEVDNLTKAEQKEKIINEMRNRRNDVPKELYGEGQSLTTILEDVNNLVYIEPDPYEEFLKPSPDRVLFKNADFANTAMLSHIITTYLSVLDLSLLKPVSKKVTKETTFWLCSLFEFEKGSAIFHEEMLDGIVKCGLMSILKHFPDYSLNGYNSIVEKPPIFYVSAATPSGYGSFIISQLGLPASCLYTLPTYQDGHGSTHCIDVKAFASIAKEHKEQDMVPCFLLAHAGTLVAGHTDNFEELLDICDQYKIWLHIEGHNVATRAMYSPPSSIRTISKANSLTLVIRDWLGIPGAPVVTLYKDTDPSLAVPAGLTAYTSSSSTCLRAMPLWLSLRQIGMDKINFAIQSNADLSQQITAKLTLIDNIELKLQIGCVSAVVVFRFHIPSSKFIADSEAFDQCLVVWENSVNKMLYRMLCIEHPKVVLEMIPLDGGVCYLKFSPMQSAQLRRTIPDDVHDICNKIKHFVGLVVDTKEKQEVFNRTLNDQTNVQVEIRSDECELGCFRYVPEYCIKPIVEGLTIPDHDEKVCNEIDRINRIILDQISKDYPDIHFKMLNEQSFKHCSIAIGLITRAFDCSLFAEKVFKIGKETEDVSSFVASFGDVVKEMIQTATIELQNEQMNQFWEEGLMRHIPIVGSMYSWLLPPTPSVVKGRSFDLAHGSLESTEFTLQHHMQVQEATFPNGQLLTSPDVEE